MKMDEICLFSGIRGDLYRWISSLKANTSFYLKQKYCKWIFFISDVI